MAESISAQKLKKLLMENRNVAVVDVRRKYDYRATPQKIADAPWHDPEKKMTSR